MNIGKIIDKIEIVNSYCHFKFDDRLDLSKNEFNSILCVKIFKNELYQIVNREWGPDYYVYGYAHIVDKKCLKMSTKYFVEANYVLGYHGCWDNEKNYEYHLANGGENYEYYLLPIGPDYKKLILKVG